MFGLLDRLEAGFDNMLGITRPSKMRELTAREADAFVRERRAHTETTRLYHQALAERNQLAHGMMELTELIFKEIVDPQLEELRKDPEANLAKIEHINALKGRLEALVKIGRQTYK